MELISRKASISGKREKWRTDSGRDWSQSKCLCGKDCTGWFCHRVWAKTWFCQNIYDQLELMYEEDSIISVSSTCKLCWLDKKQCCRLRTRNKSMLLHRGNFPLCGHCWMLGFLDVNIEHTLFLSQAAFTTNPFPWRLSAQVATTFAAVLSDAQRLRHRCPHEAAAVNQSSLWRGAKVTGWTPPLNVTQRVC